MNRQLILYRNELKNSKIQTYKLIGIVSELVLSKEIFKNNNNKPVTVENLKLVLSLEGRLSSDKVLEDLLILCVLIKSKIL